LSPAPPLGPDWFWAKEFKRWIKRNPQDAFKCGLYCLDQMGRLTQSGQFLPKDIVETVSTPDGFSADELVQIGSRAGLQVRAVSLNDFTELPVPCVVHLQSQHFVVVRERRGNFYQVLDPIALGRRWLLASEIAEDSSGCLLVSAYSTASPTTLQKLATLPAAAAAGYRGKCHGGTPFDINDCGCDGTGGSNSSGSNNGATGQNHSIWAGKVQNTTHCLGDCGPKFQGPKDLHIPGGMGMALPPDGMPAWSVSQPYLNAWIRDVPMQYTPPYGPPVLFHIAFNGRRQPSNISFNYFYGAQVGSYITCSWFSYVELDTSENTAELMLPAGTWTEFDFPTGSSVSSANYYHNMWLEKLYQSSTLIGLRLYEPNGAYAEYTNLYNGVYFMTGEFDSDGNKTGYSYTNNLLSTVTAADGTTFQLYYNDSNDATLVTAVTNSFGTSVTLAHGETGPAGTSSTIDELTSITDAAGITSHIWYAYQYAFPLTQLVTPYGTTAFEFDINGNLGVFDRLLRITRPDSTQEFYGMINTYSGTDWPDFAASQIPTNTPVNTLDTTGRSERNTFYWNASQYAQVSSTAVTNFTWNEFKKGHIYHWLASTVQGYTHFDSISVDQAPSADGTTEGQLIWYDYTGKPSGVNYETGDQILPAVIARVMPDGSTAYQYNQLTSIGKATNVIEKWVSAGSTLYRTNSFGYAANGIDLLTVTNALGVQVSSNYFNSYHQVLTNYNALNEATIYSYDSSRRLSTMQTPAGLLTTQTYGSDGRLSTGVDSFVGGSSLRTNSFTWNSDGTMRSHTDERGLAVTNYWDPLHRPTGVLYPDGTTTSNIYTYLDLTAAKDRLGNWTYYGYNALRELTAVTNANNVVTRYGYCDCGALSSVTNAFGATGLQEVTSFVYDYQSRRTETYFPDGTSVTNAYDPLGRLTVVSDGLGSTTNYYDTLSRLVTVNNSAGQVQASVYDVANRISQATDANGVTVTNTFDNLDRLRTRTYPDTGVEAFGYTANVRALTSYTNQLGNVWTYAYDAVGRKTNEIAVGVYTNSFTYKPADDLATLKDGKSQVTTWNYDQYGRVTNKLDQASVEILRYKYDANSRLTNRWSKAMGNTGYFYDAVGNLTKIDYPGGYTDITYAYDALNRLTNMVDAAGTTKYTYYAGGLLNTEDGPWTNDTVTYTYNNRLRASLSLQQPTGTWTNGYTWDASHRLSTVASPAGTFTYTYRDSQPSTLIKKLSLPNTSYITNTYDSVARLTGTYLENSSNTVLDKSEYLYNTGNQRIRLTRTDGSYYTNTYDNIGQLKGADSTVNTEDRGYLYDAAWNLSKRTNNGTTSTFTVDTKNELTGVDSTSYSYDDNGNLTYNSTSGWTYYYDGENQLAAVDDYSTFYSFRIDFSYDGRGRLRWRGESVPDGMGGWTLTSETRYIYDGMRVIQERDGSNNPVVAYTRGIDLSGSFEGAGGIGRLLARSHGYSSGSFTNHNFYHADGNGNITYMVNGSQSVVASYRYDPFGNTISSSGALASANVYRFSSKELIGALGLYYYGYRFYDPNLQRWLNRDPLGELGGFNLYRFLGNCPPNYIDRDGLVDWPWPFNGCVVNNSTNPVQVLNNGKYQTLAPGAQTKNSLGNSEDIDGFWSNGKFYPVSGAKKITIGTNGIPTDPKVKPWNGKTGDPSSPTGRGAPDDNPPRPRTQPPKP
jgi:RHS repeat-associated protein